MEMRWMKELERTAKESKEEKFPKTLSAEDHKRAYGYYHEKYREYEEELTFEQAEEIEKQLDIYKKALEKQYPGIILSEDPLRDMAKASDTRHITIKVEIYDDTLVSDFEQAIHECGIEGVDFSYEIIA